MTTNGYTDIEQEEPEERNIPLFIGETMYDETEGHDSEHDDMLVQRNRRFEIDSLRFLRQSWNCSKDNLFSSALFTALWGIAFNLFAFVPVIGRLRFILASSMYYGLYNVYALHRRGAPIGLLDYLYPFTSFKVYVALLKQTFLSAGILWAVLLMCRFVEYSNTFVGTVVFIVAWMAYFAVVAFLVSTSFCSVRIVVDGGSDPLWWEAIEFSMKLVDIMKCGSFWALLWFMLVLVMVNIAGAMFFGVGSLITFPWTAFAFCEAYFHNRFTME